MISSSFTSDFIRQLRTSAAEENRPPEITGVLPLKGYSNSLVRMNLDNGRSLMIKKSDYDWAIPRFRSARRASLFLRRKGAVVVPKYLDLPERTSGAPVLGYWHISLPTLRDLWPKLPLSNRPDIIRSLGTMLRKVHQVKVEEYGPLGNSGEPRNSSLKYFEKDLLERLKPAVWAKWRDAVPLLDRLVRMGRELPEQEEGPVLVHNDLHMGNILCDKKEGRIKCIGLLDLEAAGGGRPESDLASAMVLHSPIFADEWEQDDWSDHFDQYLQEGYGKEVNAAVLRFFRIYHLLNLGFFSALNEDHWHAGKVAERAGELLEEC